MNKEYVKRLEDVIKQMLKPIKNIPLNLVIESISGFKILPYNPKDPKDRAVLDGLIKVANLAGIKINKEGIHRPRPNEVGNDIEPFVREALDNYGYKSSIPAAISGKRKVVGYPDIEFIDQFGRLNYLECKTHNVQNINTTQRSFYLSPSEDFKITKDAHHFVISYEIYVDGRSGSNNIYKCNKWKLLSIENLLVDVKYEFNSDNRRLYSEELIIAMGEIKLN